MDFDLSTKTAVPDVDNLHRKSDFFALHNQLAVFIAV